MARTGTTHTSGTEEVFDLLAPAYEMLASRERIESETGLIVQHLRTLGAQRVLDAGCAAGFHAIALARQGFDVVGLDRSEAMIRSAREAAALAILPVRFHVADLADAARLGESRFDAVLVLGNTLGGYVKAADRARVFRAFHGALRPGGLLLAQLRDLSTVRKAGHIFPTRSLRRDGEEWILLRRQDPAPEGLRFTVTLLYRPRPEAEWETRSSQSLAPVVPATDWKESVVRAGFIRVRAARDLAGTPRGRSGGADLVLFARRG